MEWTAAATLLLGSVIILMALGMPVALAFLASNVIRRLSIHGRH